MNHRLYAKTPGAIQSLSRGNTAKNTKMNTECNYTTVTKAKSLYKVNKYEYLAKTKRESNYKTSDQSNSSEKESRQETKNQYLNSGDGRKVKGAVPITMLCVSLVYYTL